MGKVIIVSGCEDKGTKYCVLENDGVGLCVCKHRPCDELAKLRSENERLKVNRGQCAFKSLDNTFCPEADKKITELELSRDSYKVNYETAKKYRGKAEQALQEIREIAKNEVETRMLFSDKKSFCDFNNILTKISEVIGNRRMNNYERVKGMTLDEMAEFISAIAYCCHTDCNKIDCFIKRNGFERLCTLTSYYSSGAKQWLQQESEG